MARQDGLIIIFTGPGKGKTTAALGIALRAAGHGQKTVVIQFLKGGEISGEQLVRNVPLIEVHAFGAGFFKPGDDPKPHRDAAEKGWRMAEDIILSGSADILVLDEISHAINFGFLPPAVVSETIRRKKPGLHISFNRKKYADRSYGDSGHRHRDEGDPPHLPVRTTGRERNRLLETG